MPEQLESKFKEIKGKEEIRKNRLEYIPGLDFDVPEYRDELVKWLYNHCEQTGKKAKNFARMRKKQLYAIYYSIRKKEG